MYRCRVLDAGLEVMLAACATNTAPRDEAETYDDADVAGGIAEQACRNDMTLHGMTRNRFSKQNICV